MNDLWTLSLGRTDFPSLTDITIKVPRPPPPTSCVRVCVAVTAGTHTCVVGAGTEVWGAQAVKKQHGAKTDELPIPEDLKHRLRYGAHHHHHRDTRDTQP
jgi:hypothetical protein